MDKNNRSRLLLDHAQFLYVDGLHHLLAVGDGGLFKSLAAAKLFNDAGLFEFSFKLLLKLFLCSRLL